MLEPCQRENEAMKAARRKEDAIIEANSKGDLKADLRVANKALKEVQAELAKEQKAMETLRKNSVPKAEAEKAQKAFVRLELELEKVKDGSERQKAREEEMTSAARLDAEWRGATLALLEKLLKWSRRTDVQAKMPNAANNFKAAGDPFNKTPDWLGTLAGLVEECARSTATATALPRSSERAKGGKELEARLAAEEERQGTARAKLLICRTKMAFATINARNKETLTGTTTN